MGVLWPDRRHCAVEKQPPGLRTVDTSGGGAEERARLEIGYQQFESTIDKPIPPATSVFGLFWGVAATT